MADDRMKNDDPQRNMGAGGREGQDWDKGQQTPGRNPKGDQQGGQRNEPLNPNDEAEEFGGSKTGQRGGQSGGQNR